MYFDFTIYCHIDRMYQTYPNFEASIFLTIMILTQLIRSLQPLQDLPMLDKEVPILQQGYLWHGTIKTTLL